MKVWIPDRLFDYEIDVVSAWLRRRGHVLLGKPRTQTEAILTGTTPLNAELLDGLKGLRGIVRFARGRLDLSQERAYCRRRGLAYFNVSGSSTAATAEHTVLLMLASARRLLRADRQMREGRWRQDAIARSGVLDLEGLTIGLIGVGQVGSQVARLLLPFRPRLLFHKPSGPSPGQEIALKGHWVDLATLLAQSDVVSLHARGGADAQPILNRSRIKQLKQGAIIVHTGDGRHIDLQALGQRLQAGSLTAALDVFPEEPWHGGKRWADLDNLVLTPHIAGRSRLTAERLFEKATRVLDELGSPPARIARSAVEVKVDPLTPLCSRVADLCTEGGALAQFSVSLPPSLRQQMPQMEGLFEALGCQKSSGSQDGSEESIELCCGSYRASFLLCVTLPSGSPSEPFSIIEIPVLNWLVRRWMSDFDLWNQLLPEAARGSLPGRQLLVCGYGEAGRRTAWKARQLGMSVAVEDSDPMRRLEACFDGFEVVQNESETVFAAVLDGGFEGCPKAEKIIRLAEFPDNVPPGLSDEVCGVAGLVAHTLATLRLDPKRSTERRILIEECNQSFLEALASLRIS